MLRLSKHALSGAEGHERAIPLLFAALALALAACASPTPTPRLPTIVVEVGSATFIAEVATTQEERFLGLSGRASLAQDAAMWFDLGTERDAAFVMRGMRFDIDMVWVDEALRVVHVTQGANAPADDTEGDALVRYSPGEPVRYVLEIGAGLAEAHGIAPGALVTLTPR